MAAGGTSALFPGTTPEAFCTVFPRHRGITGTAVAKDNLQAVKMAQAFCIQSNTSV